MPKHISYPKIQQYRQVVSNIRRQSSFVGLDDNGEPIYNETLPKPTLTFHGTVKLHGTNAGVAFNQEDGLWIQSRTNVITPDHDNAGFAFFVSSNAGSFTTLHEIIAEREGIDTTTHTIVIYGEWAGKGIQSGVAIAEVDKAFFIFGVKVSNRLDGEEPNRWVSSADLKDEDNRIFNIQDYKTFSVEIDLTYPELAQNTLVELTEQVEAECPVAKTFGVSGIGEGIVWTTTYKDNTYRFKTKGKKHSVSKTKSVAPVDTEKVANCKEFVEYAVTQNRVDQAVTTIFGEDEPTINKTGDIVRWVIKDVIAEEMDTLKENGLEPKDVNKYIGAYARELFHASLQF